MPLSTPRIRAGAAAVLAGFLLAAGSSGTEPAATSATGTSGSASSAGAVTSAGTSAAITGSGSPGSSADSSAGGSAGGSASVAKITGSGSGEIDVATYDAVIANAPKADDATIEASPWAKAIKDRGVLRTGGTETGALFSLLDLETGKVVGFDAGLSQMLAQYILGEPTT